MSNEAASILALEDLAALQVAGDDAATFLQAQLSSDVHRLEPGEARITSWNTPAGKAVAVPWLLRPEAGRFFLVLPQELAATVADGLRRFVLRSRVSIDLPADLAVFGATGEHGPEDAAARGALDDGTGRTLFVAPAGQTGSGTPPAAMKAWREAGLGSARPQVYAVTSGRFVPQMLNLDLVGGISFDKGCYPGQEVIARARYLGRVKRRMGLFAGTGAGRPEPGQPLAGRANTSVIDACETAGGWLALAVTPLADEALPDGVEARPLPYALPGDAPDPPSR